MKKESIETKTVEEKVIVEQYTYGEIANIQMSGQRNIEIYNDSINLVKSTENPEVFFPRLSLADESLTEVIAMIQQYSFLTVDGDNLEEELGKFKQEKEEHDSEICGPSLRCMCKKCRKIENRKW